MCVAAGFKRFKGSKVQMVFWKRFRISIIYFILIYIIIYINITIFEYFMTPFEFGFWTFEPFEPLVCKEIRIMLTLQSENSWLTILRRLTLFLRTLTFGSGKNLDACNCVYPNLDWCTIQDMSKLCNCAFVHLVCASCSKTIQNSIIWYIIYILYIILITN